MKKNSKNFKKNNFNFKLIELFNDKINSKFDIFYYLKWIRKFKNFKEYVFANKINEKSFDCLANIFYRVKISDTYDHSSLKNKNKIKIKSDNLPEYLDGINESYNNELKNYFISKIDELL